MRLLRDFSLAARPDFPAGRLGRARGDMGESGSVTAGGTARLFTEKYGDDEPDECVPEDEQLADNEGDVDEQAIAEICGRRPPRACRHLCVDWTTSRRDRVPCPGLGDAYR
jgi:hypothetical protein